MQNMPNVLKNMGHTSFDHDILRAQYFSEERKITSSKLAQAVGYANYNAANLQYGLLGHEMADLLNYKPPKWKSGEPMWYWALSVTSQLGSDSEGHYEFEMRPELAKALQEMNWVK